MAHDPLQEASDPTTALERLGELAQHKEVAVRQTAWRNPSLPEDVWREILLEGEPEAWANPMAPFYILTWTQREEDVRSLEDAAYFVTHTLFFEPERCSPEGKALLASKMQEWWATCESVGDMMRSLGWWASVNSEGSFEHREVVRLLVLCVRTAPDLTADDRQALDLLAAWSEGGEDRRKEGYALASSKAITETHKFAQKLARSPWGAIFRVLEAVQGRAGNQARDEHSRILADLIRQERPLPPEAG
jgi:hypothetical protein